MESMGNKPRRRRSFTPEFKAEIVELRQRGDRSVGQVSRDFDLTKTAVREWVKQAERDAGIRRDRWLDKRHVVAGSLTTGSLDGLKDVTPVAVDLTAPDGPTQLIRHATEEHRRLDLLVNNVGAVRMRTKGFFGTSDEDFAWAMQMNFFIALRASRAALTAMVGQGTGAIVNVASVNAFFQPDATTIDSSAAKAALVNLTKTLTQEFGPHGIRVNAVSPGPVATDLWLGEHGITETVAKATGSTPTPRARRSSPASAGSPPAGHHPGGGRHTDHVPGLRPGRQHHRRQLPH